MILGRLWFRGQKICVAEHAAEIVCRGGAGAQADDQSLRDQFRAFEFKLNARAGLNAADQERPRIAARSVIGWIKTCPQMLIG